MLSWEKVGFFNYTVCSPGWIKGTKVWPIESSLNNPIWDFWQREKVTFSGSSALMLGHLTLVTSFGAAIYVYFSQVIVRWWNGFHLPALDMSRSSLVTWLGARIVAQTIAAGDMPLWSNIDPGLWRQIDDLVQDCSKYFVTHWSYCSLALSHRNGVMEGYNNLSPLNGISNHPCGLVTGNYMIWS